MQLLSLLFNPSKPSNLKRTRPHRHRSKSRSYAVFRHVSESSSDDDDEDDYNSEFPLHPRTRSKSTRQCSKTRFQHLPPPLSLSTCPTPPTHHGRSNSRLFSFATLNPPRKQQKLEGTPYEIVLAFWARKYTGKRYLCDDMSTIIIRYYERGKLPFPPYFSPATAAPRRVRCPLSRAPHRRTFSRHTFFEPF